MVRARRAASAILGPSPAMPPESTPENPRKSAPPKFPHFSRFSGFFRGGENRPNLPPRGPEIGPRGPKSRISLPRAVFPPITSQPRIWPILADFGRFWPISAIFPYLFVQGPELAPRNPRNWPKSAEIGQIPTFRRFSQGHPQMPDPAPPGGPSRGSLFGGPEKCTFRWVFNNSPSRDRIRPRNSRGTRVVRKANRDPTGDY